MKKRFLLAAALAATTPLALALPAGADRLAGSSSGGRPLTATLTGAAETPSPTDLTGSGDPDGSGTARITVNPGKGEICYELSVSNIAPATMAHIHEAPAGSAGPVVQGLAPPSDGTSEGCVTNPQLARDLIKDPADYYVNVHNVPFPAGALRGQLG